MYRYYLYEQNIEMALGGAVNLKKKTHKKSREAKKSMNRM